MLAFGAGRWPWALVWAPVSGRTGQGDGTEGERRWKAGREGRIDWRRVAKNDGGNRAVGELGSLGARGLGVSGAVGTGWDCGGVMMGWHEGGEAVAED